MKTHFILIILLSFVLSSCRQPKTEENNKYVIKDNRKEFIDERIAVDSNNVPTDSNQLYFPVVFFPAYELVSEYEDSLTFLISEMIIDDTDTLRTYSKIIPNEFDTGSVSHFSKYLFALKEPLLFNKETEKEVYRLTWLRTFANPVIIRIEKTKEKSYRLIWKKSDGTAGYTIGKLKSKGSKRIKEKDWKEFKKLLIKARFWKLEYHGTTPQLDGSICILEGSTQKKYQVFIHSDPFMLPKFYKACNFLINLSEINTKEEEKD